MENTRERLIRYLEDAWAIENGLITHLKEMAEEVNDAQIQTILMEHRAVTMQQKDRLEARINALGKEPSTGKGFLTQLLGRIGEKMHSSYDSQDRTVQNLLQCYAVENFEVAMYEAMESYANIIGDTETAELARSHKAQEQEAAHHIWPLIGPTSARVSVLTNV